MKIEAGDREMIRTALVSLLALVGPAHLAAAEMITVCSSGCDYTSINAAIAAASDGDVIQLSAETYLEGEQIKTKGKTVTIRGVTGKQGEPATIIGGQNRHRILVTYEEYEETSGAVTLENLILQSGKAPLDECCSGVITNGDLTATNCVFRNHTSAAHSAVAVYNGSGTFHGCRFEQNYALYQGGAVSIINDTARGEFTDCAFVDNFVQGAENKFNYIQGGGAIFSFRALVFLTNCHFTGNEAGAPTFDGPDGHGYADAAFILDSCTFSSCCSITPPDRVFIDESSAYDSWCDDCRANIDCRNDAVDAEDLGYLLARWNTDDPQSDIDGDGLVTASDLGFLFAAWGPCQ